MSKGNYLSDKEYEKRNQYAEPLVYIDAEERINNSVMNSKTVQYCYDIVDRTITSKKNDVASVTSIANLDIRSIIDLSNLNINNIIEINTDRIIQDTLMNVYSAIESSYIKTTGLLKFFNFQQKIYERLIEYKQTIKWQLRTYYSSIINLINDTDEEFILESIIKNKNFMTYTHHYIQSMIVGILSIINSTIQLEITYVLNNLNLLSINDVNDLRNKLTTTFVGIENNSENHFWLYSVYAMNHAMYQDISPCYSTIMDNIGNIVYNLDNLTYAYLYEDIITIKRKAKEINKAISENNVDNKFM